PKQSLRFLSTPGPYRPQQFLKRFDWVTAEVKRAPIGMKQGLSRAPANVLGWSHMLQSSDRPLSLPFDRVFSYHQQFNRASRIYENKEAIGWSADFDILRPIVMEQCTR